MISFFHVLAFLKIKYNFLTKSKHKPLKTILIKLFFLRTLLIMILAQHVLLKACTENYLITA